ncbi:MAG: ribose 5-phosphate isomerase B [Deltaproteobacteria bacterium]|jgi:ribose 5-phosphate isomerase B|nr:ribose 5-phosphate isomerase B [Deltaproteobacteria bacterium]
MPQNIICLGSDHAGPELKRDIADFIKQLGYTPLDFGVPLGTVASNYPEVAQTVGRKVLSVEGSLGILICGTGNGMAMVANKIPGIRAALCTSEFMAQMARSHNNANILTLGARVLGQGLALSIVQRFLTTNFEGGRHAERIALFN